MSLQDRMTTINDHSKRSRHSYEFCQPYLYPILLIDRLLLIAYALKMTKTHTTLFPTPPLDECKATIENVFELTPVPSNDGQVSVAANMSWCTNSRKKNKWNQVSTDCLTGRLHQHPSSMASLWIPWSIRRDSHRPVPLRSHAHCSLYCQHAQYALPFSHRSDSRDTHLLPC